LKVSEHSVEKYIWPKKGDVTRNWGNYTAKIITACSTDSVVSGK
jgi:hypothetical protein